MNEMITVSGAKKIDKYGKKWGKEFAEAGVTTSQLRQIYAEVKRAQTRYRSDGDTEAARTMIILLKPKLAYAASRHDEMEIVRDRFLALINKQVVPEDAELTGFFETMEATVAYHQYYQEVEDV
jgi:CRISPR-associated protein Csm2